LTTIVSLSFALRAVCRVFVDFASARLATAATAASAISAASVLVILIRLVRDIWAAFRSGPSP
jgi:hypothetical protein